MITFTYTVDLRGFSRWSLQAMRDRARYAADQINRIMIEKLHAKLNIKGTGRIYPSKRGGGLKHKASKPGRPPAPDTGNYRDSWEAKIDESSFFVQASIGTPLWEVYGRRLELGGSGGGVYIAPRPHAGPAFAETEREINRLLKATNL